MAEQQKLFLRTDDRRFPIEPWHITAMSSFKRKSPSSSQAIPTGTKSSPALPTLLLTSSGVPSLDDVLGGGIQLGTSFLILNPDSHSAHTDLLQKYFIAQGLASDQEVHVFDSDARNLINSCIWMAGASITPTPDEDDTRDSGEGKVKIAWRYENLQKFKTTVTYVGSDQYVSLLWCLEHGPKLRLEKNIVGLLIFHAASRRTLSRPS